MYAYICTAMIKEFEHVSIDIAVLLRLSTQPHDGFVNLPGGQYRHPMGYGLIRLKNSSLARCEGTTRQPL